MKKTNPDSFIICPACGRRYRLITSHHIRLHGYNTAGFKKHFRIHNLRCVELNERDRVRMSFCNPTKGRKHTLESLRKMSKNRRGKGIGVAGKYIRTKAIRRKISKGVSRYYRKNVFNYKHQTIISCSKILNGQALTRSSWERMALAIFASHPLVDSIEMEPFSIPYDFDGYTHNYIPDFLISYAGIKELCEVKPENVMRADKPFGRKNLAKIEALRDYCLTHNYNMRLISSMRELQKLRRIMINKYAIIPRVTKHDQIREYFAYPAACPRCNAPTAFEGEFLMCPNPQCPGKLEGDFKKWIRCLELDFLGDAFIDKMFARWPVKGLWNLYQLRPAHIAKLAGYAGASAQRAYDQIQKRKELPLALFLGALNIPNAAESTFQLVVDAGYDTLEKIQRAPARDLARIHGIGDITAKNITDGLWEKEHTIEKLLEHITIAKPIQGKFSGMSFCFTGEIEIKRGMAERLVKENGGTVKSSVVKDLTYLVQADPKSQSGKAQKARQYGVKVISGTDFLKLVDFNLDTLRRLGGA